MAFRLDASGELAGLGPLNAGGWSAASTVSGDGQVIGGIANGQAFLWTQSTGIVALGYLPGDAEESGIVALSSDGQWAAGYSRSEHSINTHHAFRWSARDGMQPLGVLPGASWSSPHGISADGTKIVGTSGDRPFLWDQATGMQSLGALDPLRPYGSATAISADGNVVVGYSGDDYFFIWTAAKGMVPFLSQDYEGDPLFVSNSGELVVGTWWVWTPRTGHEWIGSYLARNGVTFSGWRLEQITSVSADATTFVGNGVGPDGLTQAWMARTAPSRNIPFNLRVQDTKSDRIVLTWKKEAPQPGAIYALQAARSVKGPWTTLASVPPRSSSFTHNFLTPETYFRYRIQQINGNKLSSNFCEARTAAPKRGAFVILFADPESPTSIRLEWSDTTSEESYRIQRRLAKDSRWMDVGSVERNQTVWEDDTIFPTNPGQIYSYRIIATSLNGRTIKSNIVSVTAASWTPPE